MRLGAQLTRHGFAVLGAIRRALGALAVLCALATLSAGPARAVYFPPNCPTVTFHSEPVLGAQRACMNVGVATRRTGGGTYLFTTPSNDGIGIFRDTGTLVWWEPRPAGDTEEHDATVVHLFGQTLVGAWAGTAQLFGHNGATVNSGTVLLYNERYQQVGEITAGPPFAPARIDMHEFRITPQGDALIGIYVPVKMSVHGQSEIVFQYVVQKLSLVQTPHGIRTGRVLFQWNSFKHVPLSASYLPDPGAGNGWDYFHGNAIDQDSDGNLIVSARDTWGIYKISVKTGRILWQVGAKGDNHLALPWCYQHDISALGNNEYSVFDDGAVGPGCVANRTWHPSRGLIFRVDPSRRPAGVTLVRAYTHHPAIYAQYLGSMQRLSNGDVVVGWGTVPQITEYSANGQHVLMDLSLSHDSFRGFRYPWVGDPASPPSVAANLEGSGTQVWASWNGATSVVSWRVLGGTSPGSLTAVHAPVHRQGFETPISLRWRYQYVAVQALSASGRVLGTSQTVNAALG